MHYSYMHFTYSYSYDSVTVANTNRSLIEYARNGGLWPTRFVFSERKGKCMQNETIILFKIIVCYLGIHHPLHAFLQMETYLTALGQCPQLLSSAFLATEVGFSNSIVVLQFQVVVDCILKIRNAP